MSWQGTVLVAPTLLATTVALVLAGYAATLYRNGRRDSLVALYFWISVATVVWTGFSALKLLHTDPATKLLFYRILHVGAASLPPLVFLFVVAYTDRTRWLRRDVVGGVFLLPTVFVGLLFVNPAGVVVAGTEQTRNGLVILRVVDGPGQLLLLLYSVAFILGALGLVLLEAGRVGSAYYPQAILIGVGVVVPMVFSGLTTAGVPPFTHDTVNFVPTAAAVSVGAFGVLLFRYRLLDLPPLAYSTAMKYSPDTLFVLDAHGRVVHANEHGTEFLETPDQQLGAPLSDALPGFDSETASGDLIERESESGESTYHRVFVEALTRGGRQVGWVVVLRDETDQQRRQTELRRQNDRMELLASTISHDPIRNPLNVAQLRLELAREDAPSEELDRVDAAHTRMEEIIDQLLVLVREDREIDDQRSVRLSTVVERAWENVATSAGELSVEASQTIEADPTMLQHVFENLFRNAVEHGSSSPDSQARRDAVDSADGGPVSNGGHDQAEAGIRVTVGELSDGFFVEDDGPGIPEAERDAVLRTGYSTSSEGTGLGLQIVQQVVGAHGWELSVTEGRDGGARFEISGVD